MKYWKRLNPNSTTQTVESYSHNQVIDGAIEISEKEFQDYIAALPPPAPPIDWKALWLAADTVAKKLAVLAKKQGLE